MSEILTDVKEVIKERVSGPFFGYIFISFFLFNWDWFYFFIFSDLSAEKKLSSISISYQYFRGIIAPIASGFIMCLAVPFINAFIKKLHSIAVRITKEIDYDNENSLEAIKADRELQNSLKRQKASIISAEVDELENKHKSLTYSTETLRTEVAQLTAKGLELKTHEQVISTSLTKLKIELQNKNATAENFERLNELIKEKNNENIKLSSSLDDLELLMADIVKYIEFRDGNRPDSILLTHKVEEALEKYGYKKNKVESKKSTGLGAEWGLPTNKGLGIGSWLSNNNSITKAWNTGLLGQMGGLSGSVMEPMPAVKEAEKMGNLTGVDKLFNPPENSSIFKAAALAEKLTTPSSLMQKKIDKTDEDVNNPPKGE
ncbi:hypothetical protein [Serratia marcescens]|uniref:hypothetical protein n=2 Tax=Serratia TaxID=613 RepID=UPI0027E50DE2|nr:hypothetical protein [Serratia marcescens]MCS3410961.1 hypothetical protein [Serratia marcescens]BEN25120.1 hypothetical protein SMKC032_12150 [Serratia marcescens]HEJ8080172.1 hypothetical protein [Serratia marcescens]